MEGLALRPLCQSDLDRVLEIALAAWEPIFAHRRELMGPEVFGVVHPDWRAEKAADVRDSCLSRCAAVAELEGKVVAFITYRQLSPTVGEITNNAVDPEYHRRGIASAQYEFALARLREKGCTVAKVSTGGDQAHAPAREAYRKAGFDIEIPAVTCYRKL